jgi:transcription antitermination factor NusG
MTSLQTQLSANEFVPMSLVDEDMRMNANRKWYAVYTMPRSERSVAKHLDMCQIESFLPTCESVHVWKNRQRVKIVQPLFPSYLFVRIRDAERTAVLRSPVALRIIGNCHGPSPIADAEIDFLRSDFCKHRVEPYVELVVGKKVRVKTGPMQGVQGVLVQKRNSLRFVLKIELINQCAAVEVTADELEAVLD